MSVSKSYYKTPKRIMSVIMAVLMILSAWVFVAPTKAEAVTSQTAGSYYVKFTGQIKFSSDWRCSKLNNEFTAGWDSTTNDSAGIVIRHTGNNGRASGTNDKTVDIHNWFQNLSETTYTEYTVSTTVTGFPTGFYICLDQNDFGVGGGTTYLKMTKIEVGSSESNLTTIWTGNSELASTNGTKKQTITQTWTSPSMTATGASWTMSGSTTQSPSNMRQTTYSVTSAKDQYGVNWGFSSVTWESDNTGCATIDNNGRATFSNNGGKNYSVTFTPTLVHSDGNATPSGKAVSVTPTTPTLSLNTEVNPNILAGNLAQYYSFTPTTSGDYIFFSYKTETPDSLIYVYQKNTSNNANCGTEVGHNDDYGDPTLRALLGGVHNNQSYLKVSLTAGTTYIVKAYCYSTNTGTFPMKVCKSVDITFNATGGATTFTKSMPAGHTMLMNSTSTGLTRNNHTLISWSTQGTNQQPKYWAADTTSRTIPSSNTTYYALWYPAAPTSMILNEDKQVSISQDYEIQFFSFTPQTTRTYAIYSHGPSSNNPFGILYSQSAYNSNGAILDYDDNTVTTN